jgi:hypothetical protein
MTKRKYKISTINLLTFNSQCFIFDILKFKNMRKNYYSAILVPFCLLICGSSVKAQKAFQKGSLMVSISEGSIFAKYKTDYSGASSNTTGTYKSNGVIDDSQKPASHGECTPGTRDPLILEYGVSNKISLGVTSGADIFMIDPSKFYGFKLTDGNKVKVTTGELTFDGSYHFLVNKRLDMSAFAGLGGFNVSYKGKDVSDSQPYSYNAHGSMARAGVRVRYYFFHKFGVFGQISSYSGKCTPRDVKGKKLDSGYTTKISGSAIEAGLCYRFIR